MEHSFNVEVATKYGIEEAILLKNIYHWIEKNKANEKHFYNGKYWTYNSIKAFNIIFPYIPARTIARKLQNLINAGLIETDNFNTSKYDRTLWYSLTNLGESICQNVKSICENVNSIRENGEPIPNINTNINTDIKQYIKENVIKEKAVKNTKKDFVAPTYEEVYEYAKSRNRTDIAQKFFDYFNVGNWVDSEGKPVRNWKQKFVTWDTRNAKKTQTVNTTSYKQDKVQSVSALFETNEVQIN